jgi:hypothetical protein
VEFDCHGKAGHDAAVAACYGWDWPGEARHGEAVVAKGRAVLPSRGAARFFPPERSDRGRLKHPPDEPDHSEPCGVRPWRLGF